MSWTLCTRAPRPKKPNWSPVGSKEPIKAVWSKLIKRKVSEYPQFSGGGPTFWTLILDLDGPGPGVLWGCDASFSSGVYIIKVAVQVLNRYPPNSAWPQGQGIGLEVPAGPQKANVWLSQVIFCHLSVLKTRYAFKTLFKSSRVMPGNPSNMQK